MEYEVLSSSGESDVDNYTSSDNSEIIDIKDGGAGLATRCLALNRINTNHLPRTAHRMMWLATQPMDMRNQTIGWEISIGRFYIKGFTLMASKLLCYVFCVFQCVVKIVHLFRMDSLNCWSSV